MEPISTIVFASFIVHLVADRIPRSKFKTKLAQKIRIIVSISSLFVAIASLFIIVFLNR
jgi:hypothetical protein